MHEAQQHGVIVNNNGKGILEYCDIFANQAANVAIASGGDPHLQRNTISKGQDYGIIVADNGRGTIDNCTLLDNVQGALSIEPGCAVDIKKNNFHS
ncbi:right-handed parallel beta-helix repeat-containing protein [Dictyobacter vulcani]|uniref:right-handed parallel beta-helix repeat-containing protein n=1 Tax=Dictyobacter vulcani TaxID=2607529 RepID=UPI0012502E23